MKNRITQSSLEWLLFSFAIVMLALAGSAQQKPLSEEIDSFLAGVKPRPGRGAVLAPKVGADQTVDGLRSWKAGDGCLTFVGSPPGQHFAAETAVAAGLAEETTAKSFLNKNGRVFGVTSSLVDFTPFKRRQRPGRTSVRLQQIYAGLPIVAAEVAVQVNADGGVDSLLSHIARDTSTLDQGLVNLRPSLSNDEASTKLREYITATEGAGDLTVGQGQLQIFVPAVMEAPGPIRLVWELEISGTAVGTEIHEKALVDAHTGEVVRRLPLIHSALDRRVYDANNSTSIPSVPTRSEGQSAVGIVEVDNAYLFLGDTYNYYLSQHGRDSIDGKGMRLDAVVRLCSATRCPWPNAQWTGSQMQFGSGFVADDITAHELTHGVTANESQLMYENDSGAINEAISDIFGEFVDLGNGKGNDTDAVRWLIGEDRGAAFRSMTNPPAMGNPDRLGSSLYVAPVNDPAGGNDYGGVHSNSGIINKLCVLLTDGATFNGLTIQGMGIPRIADLFYEANVTILLSGSNYQDLFNALKQAAVNLGWTAAERRNLLEACVAVEIGGVYVDNANTCSSPNGIRRCRSHGDYGPYRSVADGVNSVTSGEYLAIVGGSYNERFDRLNKPMTIRAPDGPVTIGQ